MGILMVCDKQSKQGCGFPGPEQSQFIAVAQGLWNTRNTASL